MRRTAPGRPPAPLGNSFDKEVDRLAALIDALLHGAPGALATLKARVADFDAPPLSLLFDPAIRDARNERSPETDEGLAAFKEKRKPNWKGR